MKRKPYPQWICEDCGRQHGRVLDRTSTWHEPDPDNKKDQCGWCGTRDEALTEPRDFGYPEVKT